MLAGELVQFIQALRRAETDTVAIETKKATSDLPRRLRETLSSLANTPGGGVILLGLDEERAFAVTGVADAAKIQSDVASLCDQMVLPLRPLIEIHQVEDHNIVTVEVPELPPEQKPCYYRGAGLTNGAFIRVADGDRRLTQYEVQMMFASWGQPREDEIAVSAAGMPDLDPGLTAQYLQRIRWDEGSPFRTMTDDDVLKTNRILVRDDGGVWVPSLAGLLTLGQYPQKFFPSLEMTFVVYPTTNIGEPGPGGERFLDNRRIEGSVPLMVLKALDALKRNMKRRAVIRGLLREDIWEYPEDVLREALVNALAHRDYSPTARGTPVRVQMFPNRLVIVNPGGLFGPVTVDRLGEIGISSARNQTLMKILEDLPVPRENRTLCENRGSGIGAMLTGLRRAGLEPPMFENTISAFRILFPNHTLLDEDTLNWLAQVGSPDLTDSQRLALAYTRRNDQITNSEYRRLTNLDSRDVSRELHHLVDLDLLLQSGGGRWNFYELNRGHTRPAARVSPSQKAGRRDRMQEIIAVLSVGGSLSRREIAERIGLGPSGTLKWLNQLIQIGVVETMKPRRSKGARYQLRSKPPK